MSSQKGEAGEPGFGGEVESEKSSSSNAAENGGGMKRAAAKRMIERYYYQLVDGCGRTECDNQACASCNSFTYRDLTKNDAAVTAVELFMKKAKLCDPNAPNKVAREEGKLDSGAAVGACFTAASALCVPSTSASIVVPAGPAESSIDKITPYLTLEKLRKIIDQCRFEDNWSHLIHILGKVYGDPQSLMLSFRKEVVTSKEELRAMEVDLDKDQDEKEMETDAVDISSVAVNSPDSSHSKGRLKPEELTLDLDAVRAAYKELFELPEQPFLNALINGIISLSSLLEMDLRYHRQYCRDPNFLNIFLIVFEIPVIHSPEFIEKATPQFCKVTGFLPLAEQASLARIWSRFSPERLKNKVDCLQQLITVRVIQTNWNRNYTVNDDDGISGAAKVMKLLYYASIMSGDMDPPEVLEQERTVNEALDESLQELLQGAVGRENKERNQPRQDPLEKELGVVPINCRHPVVPWEDFVNEPLSDNIEMDIDYTYYKSENESKFSFMTHSFLLTSAVKNLGMYYDNRIRMMNERRASLLQSLVNRASTTPYLRLKIRRDHIIDDSLVALELVAMDNPQDLKKQLYVEFEGEQGIDEGGVSKEFFQLIVEEIFNPDIGMFTYNEETQFFWFNPTSFENDGQFALIGIVLGLAIYNNIILDIHFPMVVYRKLMGKKGNFEDLKDSHPTLARGLEELLKFEGDVEEVFMQTFRISYKDIFDTTLYKDLKEGGDQIPVTNENKREFVELYRDFLLNESIEKQFRAFKRGFQMVTDESPLKMLFRPEEVEMLVCGSKLFDFHALEEATEYDGGFTSESPSIKHFWEIVHEMTEEQKRQLLQFATGSDRVPVGGLAKLKLIIARNGPDSDRLPTSHTCFNVLLLPDYRTKEKLKERLLVAITHAKGFGML